MAAKNIYIKDLRIENYKSLKKSKISFQNGLNIVIGKNGSGKSNLLEFIYFYASRNYFTNRLIPRSLNSNFSVLLEYFENSQVNLLKLLVEKPKKNESVSDSIQQFEITINKNVGTKKTIINQKLIVGDRDPKKYLTMREMYNKELQAIQSLNRTYIRFQYPKESLWVSKPTKFTIDDNGINFENPDYSFELFWDLEMAIEFDFSKAIEKKNRTNVTSLKKSILSFLEKVIKEKNINQELQKFSPIQEIRINPNINIYSNDSITIVENLCVEFRIENNWMPWSYLSDGTKRLFYMISEVISSDGRLILVEEPELGIHPHQLFQILQFLKDKSFEKQIILSTHSPMVLDILSENELDRIIVTKYDKGTKFTKLTKSQINKAKRYIQEVGDLSYYWLHSDLEA